MVKYLEGGYVNIDDSDRGEFIKAFFEASYTQGEKIPLIILLGAGAPIYKNFTSNHQLKTNKNLMKDLKEKIFDIHKELMPNLEKEVGKFDSLTPDHIFTWLLSKFAADIQLNSDIRVIWRGLFHQDKLIPPQYYILANWIITGVVDGVITTNFDETLELALRIKENQYLLGKKMDKDTEPLKPFPYLLISDEDYETYTKTIQRPSASPFIAKMHGSVNNFSPLQFSSGTKKIGLSDKKRKFIENLFHGAIKLIIVGWGGDGQELFDVLENNVYNNPYCNPVFVNIKKLEDTFSTKHMYSKGFYYVSDSYNFFREMNTVFHLVSDFNFSSKLTKLANKKYSRFSQIFETNLAHFNKYQINDGTLIFNGSAIEQLKYDAGSIYPWKDFKDPIYGFETNTFRLIFKKIFAACKEGKEEYGSNFFALFKAILYTPEFCRLSNIMQLSFCYNRYPFARHTRWEHSLGCCYLVSETIKNFAELNEIKEFLPEEIASVILAALLHDVGHTPYSHIFDLVFQRSSILLKNLLKIAKGENHEIIGESILLDTDSHINKIITSIPIRKDDLGNDVMVQPSLVVYFAFEKEIPADTAIPKNFYLRSLISSKSLDLDRVDYILRDYYYCFNKMCVTGAEIENFIKKIRFVQKLGSEGDFDYILPASNNWVRNLTNAYLNLWENVYLDPINRGIQLLLAQITTEYLELGIIEANSILRITDRDLIAEIIKINNFRYTELLELMRNLRIPKVINIPLTPELSSFTNADPEIQKKIIDDGIGNFLNLLKGQGIECHSDEDIWLFDIPFSVEKFSHKMRDLKTDNPNDTNKKEFEDACLSKFNHFKLFLSDILFEKIPKIEFFISSLMDYIKTNLPNV